LAVEAITSQILFCRYRAYVGNPPSLYWKNHLCRRFRRFRHGFRQFRPNLGTIGKRGCLCRQIKI
jgi:hypothetical protein